MGKETVEKLKDKFHPNRITASGLLLSGASVGLMLNPSTAPYGFGLLVASSLTDGLDGYFARRWNRKTKVGAIIDPFVDKGRFLIAMGVAAGIELFKGNYFLSASVLAGLAVDGVSQKQRGDLVNQVEEAYNGIVYPENCEKDDEVHSIKRANNFGKLKTGIQTGATWAYWGYHVFKNYTGDVDWCEENLGYVLGGALAVSAVLGIVGIVGRVRNGKKKLEEIV